jgi:MFS family permease
LIAWPGLVAPVIAPLAGGVILTVANWHWLFLINLPLGAVAFAVAWRLIRSAHEPPPPRLDRVGVALTCGGLAGLTYTAHLVSEPAIPWASAAAVGAASALVLAASVRHLLRAPAPLVNLRTLRIPTFGAAIGGSGVFWLVVGSVPFLLPLLFQTVFGWSPIKSGALVLFLFVGNIGIKPATTWMLFRFNFRPLLVATTAALAVTVVACGFIAAATPLPLIALVVLLGGVTRSVGLTCYATMAFSDVPQAQMRDANTLLATNQQLAAGLGIALATVLLRIGRPLGGLFAVHPGHEAPFTVAFVLLALLALVPIGGALRLHPTAGDSVRPSAAPEGAPAAG